MRLPGDPPDALKIELLQEMAASLGHAGRRVERALEALATSPPDEREERVQQAGELLWYYVVQREACGLRDTEDLLDRLGVPGEVRLRMGHRMRAGREG
jgi:hypothetical protein